jgi:DNA polymerase-3 subunit beta
LNVPGKANFNLKTKDKTMKIIIDTNELKNTLKAVKPFIQSKGRTLPILENIVIDATTSRVTITGYELDTGTGIRFTVDAVCHESGKCLVNHKGLSDIMSKADGSVTLTTNDSGVSVEFDATTFNLKSKPVDDYPILPDAWLADVCFSITSKDFTDAVNHVAVATGDKMPRNFTSGILFEQSDSVIHVLGTDGHRMHHVTLPGAELALSILIETETVKRIAKLSGKSSDEISFGLIKASNGDYHSHVAWKVGNVDGFTRILDTPYPEWRKVIPDQLTGIIQVDADKLARIVDRVSPIAKEHDGRERNMIRLHGNSVMTVSASAESRGTGQASIACNHIAGDDLLVGLNYGYFLDILKLHKGETVAVNYQGELDPILVKSTAGDSRESILMPVRLDK